MTVHWTCDCARAQAVAANLDKLGYTADMQFQF